jgi:hypothetical protein
VDGVLRALRDSLRLVLRLVRYVSSEPVRLPRVPRLEGLYGLHGLYGLLEARVIV